MRELGPWSGSLGLRCVGAAPLSEDGAVRSRASLTSNLRATRVLSHQAALSVDVFNLLNRRSDEMA